MIQSLVARFEDSETVDCNSFGGLFSSTFHDDWMMTEFRITHRSSNTDWEVLLVFDFRPLTLPIA